LTDRVQFADVIPPTDADLPAAIISESWIVQLSLAGEPYSRRWIAALVLESRLSGSKL